MAWAMPSPYDRANAGFMVWHASASQRKFMSRVGFTCRDAPRDIISHAAIQTANDGERITKTPVPEPHPTQIDCDGFRDTAVLVLARLLAARLLICRVPIGVSDLVIGKLEAHSASMHQGPIYNIYHFSGLVRDVGLYLANRFALFEK